MILYVGIVVDSIGYNCDIYIASVYRNCTLYIV